MKNKDPDIHAQAFQGACGDENPSAAKAAPGPCSHPMPHAPVWSATRKWSRPGKVRMGILLWALGVPIPLVLLFLLFRSCLG